MLISHLTGTEWQEDEGKGSQTKSFYRTLPLLRFHILKRRCRTSGFPQFDSTGIICVKSFCQQKEVGKWEAEFPRVYNVLY